MSLPTLTFNQTVTAHLRSDELFKAPGKAWSSAKKIKKCPTAVLKTCMVCLCVCLCVCKSVRHGIGFSGWSTFLGLDDCSLQDAIWVLSCVITACGMVYIWDCGSEGSLCVCVY